MNGVFVLSRETKTTLEKSIGLSFSQLYGLNVSGEIDLVKVKTGKSLIFTKNSDSRKIGRGNPLLARKKFTTIEEINAKIDALQN